MLQMRHNPYLGTSAHDLGKEAMEMSSGTISYVDVSMLLCFSNR
jgi:hypothetical protein